MSEVFRGLTSGRLVMIGLALLVSASVACRGKQDPGKESAAQADAAAAASPPSVPAASASTAAAVLPVEPDTVAEGPSDAGPDAGKRRLRRLVGADAGAAAVETQGAAVVEPAPADSAHAAAPGKRPAQMGNDVPYGGAAGSGAPVLKKTPLPGEDPWK